MNNKRATRKRAAGKRETAEITRDDASSAQNDHYVETKISTNSNVEVVQPPEVKKPKIRAAKKIKVSKELQVLNDSTQLDESKQELQTSNVKKTSQSSVDKPLKKQRKLIKKTEKVKTQNKEIEINQENANQTEIARSGKKLSKKKQRLAEEKSHNLNNDQDNGLKTQTIEKKTKNKKSQLSRTLKSGDVTPDDDFNYQPSTSTNKKNVKAPKVPNRSVLQLKISLQEIKPPIWRRIQVLNNTTFNDLHWHIQEAMGWASNHSHQFIIYNPQKKCNIFVVNDFLAEMGDSTSRRNLLKGSTTKLSRFFTEKGTVLLYEYDLGDSWIHEIVLEKILPPASPKAEYPKCNGGKRACPPEDCGGVEGYNHLIEVYNNPEHAEYNELIIDWLGEFNPGWDPEKFDRNKVFKRVRMWVWEPQ